MASVCCDGGTTAATCGKFAALKSTPAVPITKATTISQGTVRSPSSQARGTVAAATQETSSQAIISGRWRESRSAMAPDWRPNNRAGTEAAAVSNPIWEGEAVSNVMAVKG